jgi:nucleoid-associated protein YgaU
MARYTNIPKTKSPDGEQMYTTVRYPEIPRSENDIYVYTTIGDRFDTLALQYYGDSSLWWVIANANGNLDKSSLTPPLGSQIRIPPSPALTLSEFGELNSPTIFNSNVGGSSGY